MEGPSFYCNYLGFTPISKPPTTIAVLQTPVRDMYYKYRKSPSTGRSATLRLTQHGVLVILYNDGIVNGNIFFDFGDVVFVEAASFTPVKTSSERKPKAFFLPVEQDGGAKSGAALEKHAFLVEKNFHFLVTTSHPPLVVCVVRRPQGVKALDCHVFALDTVENALHISGLIASAQTSPGPNNIPNGPNSGRGGANFDRARGGGDVIRTEYGEYSVYRGSNQPPHDPGMRGANPHPMMAGGGTPMGQPREPLGGIQGGPPGGRNGYLGGGVPGGIVLTQDNFMSDSSSDHYHHHLQQTQQYLQYQQTPYTADVVPRGNVGGGGGSHVRASVPPHQSGYNTRPPDVIIHARPMSVDVGGDDRFPHNPIHDRSFGSVHTGGGGSSDHDSGVRMRYEEERGNQIRHSGSRGSDSQVSPRGPVDYPPDNGGGGRYLPPGARPMFPGGPISPNEPARSAKPPRFSPPPPTSPRGHSAEMMRGSGGSGPNQEIFSASNRESRAIEDETEQQAMIGGRPVAKVPPHFKAGIKVLPSDFRMVKLKHNSLKEGKRADSMSDDGYDNNKEMMDRYRELQEAEQFSKPSGQHYPDVAVSASNPNHITREYRSGWEEDGDNTRMGAGVFYAARNPDASAGDLVYNQDHRNGTANANSNIRNRYSSPGHFNQNLRSQPAYSGGVAGIKSHSAYSITGVRGDNASNSDSTSSDPSRFKDLEIANMFSKIRLDDNGNNPKSGSNGYLSRGNDMLSSSIDHGFEDGLGYLP